MEKLYKKDLRGYEIGYLITLEELKKVTNIEKFEPVTYEDDDFEKKYFAILPSELRITNENIFDLIGFVSINLDISPSRIAFEFAFIQDDYKAIKAYFIIHN